MSPSSPEMSLSVHLMDMFCLSQGYRNLTRFAIQAKGPDGKWTRKPLAYRESNNVHLLITRPPEICINLVVFCNSSLKSAVSRTIACLNVCAWKITGAMGIENIYLVMYHDTSLTSVRCTTKFPTIFIYLKN